MASHASKPTGSDHAPIIPITLAAALEPGESARPVPGFERYWVTDRGRAFSLVKGLRLLKTSSHTNGYERIDLFRGPDRGDLPVKWCTTMHQVVMLAFVGPAPTAPGVQFTIDHANGDKTDNRLENLRYVPHGVNVRLAIDNGIHSTAKLSSSAVWSLRCQAHVDGTEAAISTAMSGYGVTRATARAALAGRQWKWVPDPAERPDVATLVDCLGVDHPEAVRLLALSPFARADDRGSDDGQAVIVPITPPRPAA